MGNNGKRQNSAGEIRGSKPRAMTAMRGGSGAGSKARGGMG